MQQLEPPDIHCLNAAIGWMELGNPSEALAELDQLPAASCKHPDVLEVRWLVSAELGRWNEGLKVADLLVEIAPERSTGWLHRAYALRRVDNGGLQQAWDALLPIVPKFPKEPTISYNLSCYACQMHQLDAARVWLKRAFSAGRKEHIKKMALEDPDLEPLWPEIPVL